MGPWVGVRLLTTRVLSPNDAGKKGKKRKKRKRKEKGRDEARHRNEESIAVLLFAVTLHGYI